MARLKLERLDFHRAASPVELTYVGDRCGVPECRDERGRPGVIGVYSTQHHGGCVVRYLSCNECGWKPNHNKIVSPDIDRPRDDPNQRRLFE